MSETKQSLDRADEAEHWYDKLPVRVYCWTSESSGVVTWSVAGRVAVNCSEKKTLLREAISKVPVELTRLATKILESRSRNLPSKHHETELEAKADDLVCIEAGPAQVSNIRFLGGRSRTRGQ